MKPRQLGMNMYELQYVATAKPQFTGLLPLKQQHTLLYIVVFFASYL